MLRMEFFAQYFASKIASEKPLNVLDVGSLNVNGTYRDFFPMPNSNIQALIWSPAPMLILYQIPHIIGKRCKQIALKL